MSEQDENDEGFPTETETSGTDWDEEEQRPTELEDDEDTGFKLEPPIQ
jgi:hypothetical protein